MPLILDGTNGVNASTGSLNLQTGGTSAITVDSSQVATFANPPTSGIQVEYGSRGLKGTYGSGYYSTVSSMSYSADVVVLTNSNGAPVRRTSVGPITCSVSTAGPVANGRDQSGAFSNSSWVHFYFIWNGSTIATICSATAPPTGPTLPSGYTHWCYIGAIYLNSSGYLKPVYQRGAKIGYLYDYGQSLVLTTSSTGNGNCNISSAIPPNAISYDVHAEFGLNASNGDVQTYIIVSYDANAQGSSYGHGALVHYAYSSSLSFGAAQICTMPYISNTLYYTTYGAGAGFVNSSWYLFLPTYSVPNGGES